MSRDPWLEAARHYSSLDDRGRSEYWVALDPTQQQALAGAIGRMQQQATAAPTIRKKKAGPLGLLASACVGFLLGAIVTVALEVVVVVAGIRSFMPKLPEWEMGNPLRSDPDPMPDYCKTITMDRDEIWDCERWLERHSEGGSWGPPEEP